MSFNEYSGWISFRMDRFKPWSCWLSVRSLEARDLTSWNSLTCKLSSTLQARRGASVAHSRHPQTASKWEGTGIERRHPGVQPTSGTHLSQLPLPSAAAATSFLSKGGGRESAGPERGAPGVHPRVSDNFPDLKNKWFKQYVPHRMTLTSLK